MLEKIVDYYCLELMLAIEIDGEKHDNEGVVIKNKQRQNALRMLWGNFYSL
jgi:very-short-patch-repair endonuclease